MNSNLNFNALPNGQQTMQTIGYGLPQMQQAVQYVCGTGLQFQNSIQGMDLCLANQQQFVPSNGQTYTCINQNGMTYLAIAPNIQQPSPQCYQAIETPQGLQLFQVINNPVNFGSLCVQNSPQAQGFFPQFIPYQQETPGLESIPVLNNQHACQSPNQQYQSNINQEPENITEEVSNEEEIVEETYDDVDSDETPNLDECQEISSNEKELELDQNIQVTQDPLSALSSLTSSIPSSGNLSNSNLFEAYKNVQSSFSSNLPLPSLCNSLESQQVIGLPDQQFPPNTRAFQVLVPTPQGKFVHSKSLNMVLNIN